MTFLSDLSGRFSNLSERPRANLDQVRPGASFRRRRETAPSQTATVVELREGLCGIPHVLFKLSIECSNASRRFEDASRLLAIESFLDNYPEHVQ
ncbi:MAG TPA: hypothetical protein VJN67_04655 [Stellaceae bacterium]|nr:hypothetical protein [Stellaceae bacterium]